MARARRNSPNFGILADRFNVKVPKQPSRRRKQSPEEKGNRDRFRIATQYGKECMKHPELKAMYETGITRKKKNAYTVACTDYLNAPIIHYVNLNTVGISGAEFVIKATDDFEVKSVRVKIFGSDGSVVEEGAAIRNRLKHQMWKYETKLINTNSTNTKIKVIAEDHAANITKAYFAFNAAQQTELVRE